MIRLEIGFAELFLILAVLSTYWFLRVLNNSIDEPKTISEKEHKKYVEKIKGRK